jgi:hypothetical protein
MMHQTCGIPQAVGVFIDFKVAAAHLASAHYFRVVVKLIIQSPFKT